MNENSTKTSKKHPFLPLLTVLFLISYGLMTMLIVEQGNTIESQRLLIRQLFSDSAELTAMKGHQAMKPHGAKPHPKDKEFARPQAPQPRRQEIQPRVEAPQPVANPQRSTISL